MIILSPGYFDSFEIRVIMRRRDAILFCLWYYDEIFDFDRILMFLCPVRVKSGQWIVSHLNVSCKPVIRFSLNFFRLKEKDLI